MHPVDFGQCVLHRNGSTHYNVARLARGLLKGSLLLVLALICSCGQAAQSPVDAGPPERIVSIAPNTTEILFALGLESRVVAVSRFCNYPPAVKDLPCIGGLYDPNWEKIAALRPDLVVGLSTQQEIAGNLKLLQIPFIGVSHEHIDEILDAILAIGHACNADAKANDLVQQLRGQSFDICNTKNKGLTPPSVLVCISRDETAQRCYIAARGTFYDELINLAGGVNACTETLQKYPEISPEGLISINPDVIIDIGPTAGREAWKNYPSLSAAQNQRVAVVTNDYASVPGPRFVELLVEFRKAIQP